MGGGLREIHHRVANLWLINPNFKKFSFFNQNLLKILLAYSSNYSAFIKSNLISGWTSPLMISIVFMCSISRRDCCAYALEQIHLPSFTVLSEYLWYSKWNQYWIFIKYFIKCINVLIAHQSACYGRERFSN